ncbi:hypothetical protein D9Q98_004400 [Chlorella vulgaris]|uniref:Uncharacterized protein n=1 Tax=Chlorella vulgaris TaxID=3077 RepID=A0A9D4YXD9_CHLVU|nr:hypothetical protein D9Q98_004400 [Chlorella vulgaris]
MEVDWCYERALGAASLEQQQARAAAGKPELCLSSTAAGGGATVPLRLAAALVESTEGSWTEAGQLAQELQGGAFMGPLTSIQLFNGETTYSPPLQPGTHWSDIRQLAPLRALHELARGHATAAEELVSMRGKSVFWLQSQLERTCNDARHGAAD